MLSLLDTITGFIAIMLVLSMMVKSLTSLIKNHVDFYSRNLKHEVNRLALAVLGKSWDQAVNDLETNPATRQDAAWFSAINWERLGDEFLTKDHMEWVLTKLGAPPAALDHLEDRLEVHAANLSYAFNTRIKNLALVVGLALCLGLDINSFAIWRTLYADQQLRTTFATTYAKSALQSAEKTEPTAPAAGAAPGGTAQPGGSTASSGNPMGGVAAETKQGSSPAGKKDTAPKKASGGAAAGADQSATNKQTGSAGRLPAQNPQGAGSTHPDQEQANRDKDTRDFMNKLAGFQKDVSFGVGRIWSWKAWDQEKEKAAQEKVEFGRLRKLEFGAVEILGSLMTGILISIGAAYWHDLLRTLTSLRK